MTRPTWRVSRWASIRCRISPITGARPARRCGRGCAAGALGGRRLPFQRRLQARLGLVVERGLDDLAAEPLDAREDLVGRALAHQHHDRGAALLEIVAE